MKKIATTLVLAVGFIALAGMLFTNTARAQEESTSYSPLIQKLMARFNLKSEDVDTVIQEHRTEMMEQRKSELQSKISTLVSQNKLTQDQADKLLSKMLENRQEAKPANWKSLTQEERRSKMEEHRTEMQNWLKDNGINEDVMDELRGEGKGFRRGMMPKF